MTRSGRALGACTTAAACLGLGCGSIEDTVFTPLAIGVETSLVVNEGAGAVELPLTLSEAPDRRIVAHYRLIGLEAQNGCQQPDFDAAEGQVEWLPGSREASIRLWVFDDDLAETDERFELSLEPLEGLPAREPQRVQVTIADDDRSVLIRGLDRGLLPGATDAVDAALQSLLDEAAQAERGVVVLAPGDYVVRSLQLAPGTSLSGRGARLLRPPQSGAEVITVRVAHSGVQDSLPALLEGLTIDGRRDTQGPYRDRELEHAHLIEVGGDAMQGGRARASLEQLTLVAGTASGVMVQNDSDVSICGIRASELWRDALTASGGASAVRVRDVDATATEGTGMWLGARTPGHGQSYALEVELEDVRIAAGDVEIESTSGSSIALRRLTMIQAPLRLDAPAGVVRIDDSVLVTGVSSAEHDYWGRPRDVEITNTTLVASESSAASLPEGARTLAAVSVAPMSLAAGDLRAGPGRLLFDGCRFERDVDVERDDLVFAAQSSAGDVSIVIRNSSLAAGLSDWFAPGCNGCSLEP